MKNFKKYVSFALLALCAAQILGGEIFTERNLKLIQFKYERELKKIGASAGAMCVVVDGKTLWQKDFVYSITLHPDVPNAKNDGKPDAEKYFPLGKTSSALVSLMAVSMENAGMLRLTTKVSNLCSEFRSVGGNPHGASFNNLLACRGGMDPHTDDLVPPDSDASEFFEVAAQIAPIAAPDAVYAGCKSSIAAAGYALGYVSDKSQKDMKKSFVACARKNLFEPLKMNPRYRSFDKPMFPATAFSLCIADVAKWLCAETSPSPAVATQKAVAERRLALDAKDKFGLGWMSSNMRGVPLFMAGDYFENCANVVAVLPEINAAVAFFAESRDASAAPKVCLSGLSDVVALVSDSVKESKAAAAK